MILVLNASFSSFALFAVEPAPASASEPCFAFPLTLPLSFLSPVLESRLRFLPLVAPGSASSPLASPSPVFGFRGSWDFDWVTSLGMWTVFWVACHLWGCQSEMCWMSCLCFSAVTYRNRGARVGSWIQRRYNGLCDLVLLWPQRSNPRMLSNYLTPSKSRSTFGLT